MDYVTPYKGIHTTDVIEDKALRMLDDAIQSNNQFFMMVAPGAILYWCNHVALANIRSCSTPRDCERNASTASS